MSVFKRGKYWHYEFMFAGKRIQESARTTSKTVAVAAERNRRRDLEQMLAGIPVETKENRVRSVSDAIRDYLSGYENNHRPKTVVNAKGRLAHVNRILGSTLLPDVSETALKRYIDTRTREGVTGRSINMELGELSRAIGKPWKLLWPKLRKLEQKADVGKALGPNEETRLMAALNESKSELGQLFVRTALLTGMRYSEILRLTWDQIDLAKLVLTVGRSKTAAGTGRQIPMNKDLHALLSAHADWYQGKFGELRPDWFLFPQGSPKPSDPTRSAVTMKTYWVNVRKRAKVQCRFHDLRHTVATKYAEAGVPESTMLALMGHMSRSMLERYSHIRMAAKRDAVEALNLQISTVVPAKVPAMTETPHYSRLEAVD